MATEKILQHVLEIAAWEAAGLTDVNPVTFVKIAAERKDVIARILDEGARARTDGHDAAEALADAARRAGATLAVEWLEQSAVAPNLSREQASYIRSLIGPAAAAAQGGGND